MFLPKTIERVETEREHVLHFSSQTWICVTLPSGIGKTAKTVDQDWWNILQHEIWKFLKSKTCICVSLPSGIGKITAKTEDQDWCRFYSAATWNLKISTVKIWNPWHQTRICVSLPPGIGNPARMFWVLRLSVVFGR